MAKASIYNGKARRKSRPGLTSSYPIEDMRQYLASSTGSNTEKQIRLAEKIADSKTAQALLLSAQALVDTAQHRNLSSDTKTNLLSEAYEKADKARRFDQIGNIAIGARILLSGIPIRANLVENHSPEQSVVDERYRRLMDTSLFAIEVKQSLNNNGNYGAADDTVGLLSELAINSMLTGFAIREEIDHEWIPLGSTLSLDRGGHSGSWFKNRSDVTVWTIYPEEQTTMSYRAQVKTTFNEEITSRYPDIPVISIDKLAIRGDPYRVKPQRILKEMIYPTPENQRRTRERSSIVLDRLEEYERVIDLR